MATVQNLACIAFRPEALDVHDLLQPLSFRFFKQLILLASQWSLLAFKSFFFDKVYVLQTM